MKHIVDIKLHPLAWRVLKENYSYDGKAVDLGKGWMYNLITQGLQRQYNVAPWEFKRQRIDTVDGKVYISNYDAERFGCYISLTRAANISSIIYKRERERLCSLTMMAHVIGGIKRDVAMRHFLWKEGYNDNEMSFEALKKYYQRHFRNKEDSMYLDMRELRNQ